MNTLTLLHQSHRLFNALQDVCRDLPDRTPEKRRAYLLSRRAFNRCARRHEAHNAAIDAARRTPLHRPEAIHDSLSEEASRA